ncbi:MAG: trans-4-hydroxy-L-proline dehydratase [Christensenellales bacterium]|jgi:pyruvate formate-lyase/glycerol dehydratase family glycyl radical enzyme
MRLDPGYIPYDMKLSSRVEALRAASLAAVPRLSMERAELVTRAYRLYEGQYSGPLLRAHVFAYIMEHKAISILPGELIVGERGPAPAATPTYPEICCHTPDDFRNMNDREKVFFKVDPEAMHKQENEIMPYWQNRCTRKHLLDAMTPKWKAAYDAGIFTEFMEQRAPGHTVADNKIYLLGLSGLTAQAEKRIQELAPDDGRLPQLEAMILSMAAVRRLAERYSILAASMAETETDTQRKEELLHISMVCARAPWYPAETIWEALQGYWFCHLGVITELNTWDSYSPGRLDQHLWPIYEKQLSEGTITREKCMELLGCFWVKFNNQPAPPKVGVTLNESGTYTDFCNINIGGKKSDGSDGVNPVSYMLLETIDRMKLLQPSSNVQLSRENSDGFLRAACQVIRKGWGQPSVFNADMVAEELIRQGKLAEDAHDGGTSGCVEAGAFGKEAYILTGYFNLPKILELTLHNGIDPRTGDQLGLKTGVPDSFEELLAAFEKQVEYFVDIKVKGNNAVEEIYGRLLPAPFLSSLTADCIQKGKDYHCGGARYNTSYIQGVGIGTLTDSFSALKKYVFDEKLLTLPEMVKVLDENFSGNEVLRARLLRGTPRYGNDDRIADSLMLRLFHIYRDAVEGRSNLRGGQYYIDMLPTTCHVYFGSVTGALPEGRLAGMPLSEGISPVQGTDRNGPTGVILSASKMPHRLTGGTLLNMKFTPALLRDESGIHSLMALIRTYFSLGGHHIQFNVVGAETLRDAQVHPEAHPGLIVRVAGYSDYFENLERKLQDEIILRTENTGI